MSKKYDADRAKLYGVIHLSPLPATPFYEEGSLLRIIDDAVRAAEVLVTGGMDGALLQTMDRVYSVEDQADPARVAAMTLCASRVLDATGADFERGIQIMRHAVRSSLAVAKVTNAAFVRTDAIVGATLSTHGWVQPDSLEIMAYRRKVDAFDVRMIADIDSVHYRWPNNDESTGGVAKRAMHVGADAVCLGHPDTNKAVAKIVEVRATVPEAPIIISGFVTHENATRLLANADGAFVNSCLRANDSVEGLELEKVRRLVDAVRDSGR